MNEVEVHREIIDSEKKFAVEKFFMPLFPPLVWLIVVGTGYSSFLTSMKCYDNALFEELDDDENCSITSEEEKALSLSFESLNERVPIYKIPEEDDDDIADEMTEPSEKATRTGPSTSVVTPPPTRSEAQHSQFWSGPEINSEGSTTKDSCSPSNYSNPEKQFRTQVPSPNINVKLPEITLTSTSSFTLASEETKAENSNILKAVDQLNKPSGGGFYGNFHCSNESCNFRWDSFFSYDNLCQECPHCQTRVYPYQVITMKGSSHDKKKSHFPTTDKDKFQFANQSRSSSGSLQDNLIYIPSNE